jgi:hypothetical protein
VLKNMGVNNPLKSNIVREKAKEVIIDKDNC